MSETIILKTDDNIVQPVSIKGWKDLKLKRFY